MKTMMSLFLCMLFSVFPIKSENTVYPDTTISARLTQYYMVNPVEKLYAHQDRSFYHAGETMWMKIYQSMQSENKPISKVVYTDLINGDGQIIISTKWPLTQGIASGNIELPTNMPTGKYQIRCYTRWMQNFDANGFFTREVTIYGYPTPLPEKETSSSKVHLHLFPEGGNLINSLPSKVAFQVTNAYGKGLSANGSIIDETGKVVQHFKTHYMGKGYFYLIPEKGKKYIAVLNDSTIKVPLPKALDDGFVMNTKYFSKFLRLTVLHHNTSHDTNKTYSLIFHQDANLIASIPISLSQSRIIMDIPTSKLPVGIFTITLIDEKYHAYCERLVFINYPEKLKMAVSATSDNLNGHEKVTLKIHVQDTSNRKYPGNFSLAIVNKSVENLNERDNFYSYFFLTSELKGKIENPTAYLDQNDTLALQHLDLLLLTQGWRRYSWNEIAQERMPELTYPIEQGLRFSGKVQNISENKIKSITLQAIIRKDSITHSFLYPINKNKTFCISGIDFTGTSELLLSAYDTQKHQFPLSIDNDYSPPLSQYQSNYYQEREQTSPKYANELQIKWDLAKLPKEAKNIDKQIFHLGEVTISAPKKDELNDRRLHSKDFIYMAYDVDPNKTYGGDVKHLLNYVPGIQWVTIADAHFGKEEAQIIGLPKDCFPSFVVDGVLQRDKEAVYSLPTSLIERIEILKDANAAVYGGFNAMGGVIAIFTRKGKSENIPNKNRVCKWIGYSQTKEFYAPDSMPDEGYFVNTKNQNTIYWNPNLDTDSDGNATATFYTNNLKHEDYLIHCEGRTINGKIGVFTSPY